MKLISLKKTVLIAALAITPILAKRPKKEKPPKEPRPALTQEQREIIGEKVGQVMGSICTIAQDPHNPAAIGGSVATIIQALIAIIIEKFARRGMTINNIQNLEVYLDELHQELINKLKFDSLTPSFTSSSVSFDGDPIEVKIGDINN